ncbi:MAG: hypothetical protein ACLGH0_02835 [Thermoanaerobaculia bacterium]
MATWTVYLPPKNDERRKRVHRKGIAAMVMLGFIGFALIGKKQDAAPAKVVEVVRTETVTHTVYVEKKGPTRSPEPLVVEKPVLVYVEPLPLPEPTATLASLMPKPQPKPPLVSPLRIEFEAPGWEPVTILNADTEPVRIDAIDVVSIGPGEAHGYDMPGRESCVKTLAPGEHCRFLVVVNKTAVQLREAIRIDVRHSAAADAASLSVFSERLKL